MRPKIEEPDTLEPVCPTVVISGLLSDPFLERQASGLGKVTAQLFSGVVLEPDRDPIEVRLTA